MEPKSSSVPRISMPTFIVVASGLAGCAIMRLDETLRSFFEVAHFRTAICRPRSGRRD